MMLEIIGVTARKAANTAARCRPPSMSRLDHQVTPSSRQEVEARVEGLKGQGGQEQSRLRRRTQPAGDGSVGNVNRRCKHAVGHDEPDERPSVRGELGQRPKSLSQKGRVDIADLAPGRAAGIQERRSTDRPHG